MLATSHSSYKSVLTLSRKYQGEKKEEKKKEIACENSGTRFMKYATYDRRRMENKMK